MIPVRLGSRGSALARWQAAWVMRALAGSGVASELVIIETAGDAIADRPLAAAGGKGLFTHSIERALLDRRIDCAVHSLKDLPVELPAGCCLAAVPERADPRDVLVAAPGSRLLALPPGSRVGTGSLRRQAQALALRPDLTMTGLRGNVDTRLRRWQAGDCDALILAAAGLARLERSAAIAEWIAPELMCPAPGQGALGLECRGDDAATTDILRRLHHRASAAAVAAERAVVRRLGCGCQSPMGAHAWWEGATLRLRAVVASPGGGALVRAEAGADGPAGGAEELGCAVAEMLLEQGAGAILAAAG